MKKTILSISGKPGLYLLVSRGTSTVIVESIDAAKKRHAAGIRDRITSLNDISVYTDEGDVPLFTVFKSIYSHAGEKPLELNPKALSKDQLSDFMARVLPQYDRDRVYAGDIRKIISWYNLLVANGHTDFETPAAGSQPEATAASDGQQT